MHSPEAPAAGYIVLVDDEPRIHDMVRETLQAANLFSRFESYHDPLSFLETLKTATPPPDLILLDVHFENSGLSGIEIIPFIREDFGYLPVILLTGMEGEAIESAQDFDCIYYIPKPVSPEQLVRMVRYYLGKAQKSGDRAAELSRDLTEHKQLVGQLKTDLARIEIDSWDQGQPREEPRSFQHILEILKTILRNCELLPGFVSDLEELFAKDFALLKKTVDTLIRFDLSDTTTPGMNVHRHHCVEHVYSLRVTQKARVFYYQPPQTNTKRLLRIDPDHDTKAMDNWLKAHRDSFTADG